MGPDYYVHPYYFHDDQTKYIGLTLLRLQSRCGDKLV